MLIEFCHCETSLIKCDHTGCRCAICGGFEKPLVPKPPKTYNDGLERAAVKLENVARLYPALNSTPTYSQRYIKEMLLTQADCLRALKETKT